MAKINWLWRLIGTGIAFAIFGIGGLIIALVVFPFVKLLYQNPVRRAEIIQKVIHKSFKAYIFLLEFLGVISVEVTDNHILNGRKGTVIIANHPSLLDTVILMAQMDKAQCIVKHELWNNFFLGGVMRAANYVKNDRDPEKLISDCKSALDRGENLIIFPEGTRTRPNEILGKLHRGVANVVLESDAPIMPVILHCNHTTLAKGEPWYRIPPTKLAFKIKFTEPLEASDLFNKGETHSLNTRRMTSAIKELLEEKIVNG